MRPIQYCVVEDCNDRVKGNDLCAKHYMRARRHEGDYTIVASAGRPRKSESE